MTHATKVTNSENFNDSSDLEFLEIEIRKLNETLSNSRIISAWHVSCVQQPEDINTDDGVFEIEEDLNTIKSNMEKVSDYMNIVHQALGIEVSNQNLRFDTDIVDGKLSGVRWVVSDRHLNS